MMIKLSTLMPLAVSALATLLPMIPPPLWPTRFSCSPGASGWAWRSARIWLSKAVDGASVEGMVCPKRFPLHLNRIVLGSTAIESPSALMNAGQSPVGAFPVLDRRFSHHVARGLLRRAARLHRPPVLASRAFRALPTQGHAVPARRPCQARPALPAPPFPRYRR